ncbi:TspO/MBR family protein [uncultured archaeon]|nr:TspO/MBR family protein [uncultured archaeon]
MAKRKRGVKVSSKSKKKVNWKVLIWCLIFVFLAGGIGSFFTSSGMESQWYYLIKPNMSPANWVFPVVWNTIFVLVAYSAYFGWMKVRDNKNKKYTMIGLFAVNLILNVLWSFIFFYQMNAFGAFVELLFLWFSIFALVLWFWKIERRSSYLLLPYLFWVVFAGWLNWQAYLNFSLMG